MNTEAVDGIDVSARFGTWLNYFVARNTHCVYYTQICPFVPKSKIHVPEHCVGFAQDKC